MMSLHSNRRWRWFAAGLLSLIVLGGCAPAAPGGGNTLPPPPPPPAADGGEVPDVQSAVEPPDAASAGADAWVYTPHPVEGARANCVACHVVGTGRNPMPADHTAYGVETCVTCHPPLPPS
jgi:hypothetical protein